MLRLDMLFIYFGQEPWLNVLSLIVISGEVNLDKLVHPSPLERIQKAIVIKLLKPKYQGCCYLEENRS
jgi:hypothetical protein